MDIFRVYLIGLYLSLGFFLSGCLGDKVRTKRETPNRSLDKIQTIQTFVPGKDEQIVLNGQCKGPALGKDVKLVLEGSRSYTLYIEGTKEMEGQFGLKGELFFFYSGLDSDDPIATCFPFKGPAESQSKILSCNFTQKFETFKGCQNGQFVVEEKSGGEKGNLPDNEEPDLSLSMTQGGLKLGDKTYQGECRGGESPVKWELVVISRGFYQLNFGEENPSHKKAFSGKYYHHKTSNQMDLLFYDENSSDVLMQCNGKVGSSGPPSKLTCSVVKEVFEKCRGINLAF